MKPAADNTTEKTHMKQIMLSAALLLGTPFAASAAQVTFNLANQGDGQSSFSVVQDGITLSFSNPQGTPFNPNMFTSNIYGLGVLGGSSKIYRISSFSFGFDTAVQLLSYTVGSYNDGAGASLTYTPDTAAGWTDTDFAVGAHDFGSQVSLGAGENVDVTTVAPSSAQGHAQISSITVEANVPPVPLPGAVWGMIAGLGALGVAARRKSA